MTSGDVSRSDTATPAEARVYLALEAFAPDYAIAIRANLAAQAALTAAGAVDVSMTCYGGSEIVDPLCLRCRRPIETHKQNIHELRGMHRICRHLEDFHTSPNFDADAWCGAVGCPNEPLQDKREPPVRKRRSIPPRPDEIWDHDPYLLKRWRILASQIGPRPGMYIGYLNLERACSFLLGFSRALEGNTNVWSAFRWWLARRHANRNLESGDYIVLDQFPERGSAAASSRADTLTRDDHELAIAKLFELFEQFLDECEQLRPRSPLPAMTVSSLPEGPWRSISYELERQVLTLREPSSNGLALKLIFFADRPARDSVSLGESDEELRGLELWVELPEYESSTAAPVLFERIQHAIGYAIDFLADQGVSTDFAEQQALIRHVHEAMSYDAS